MKRMLIVAPLLLVACQDKDSITPGMWISTVTIMAGKVELGSASLDRCVSSPDAAELAFGSLRTGSFQDCAVTQSSAAAGQFSVAAHCPARTSSMADVPMMPPWMASKVTLTGKYTADTMAGAMTAELEDTLEPTKFTGTLTAQRKGDC
jgi:hypothetical protein